MLTCNQPAITLRRYLLYLVRSSGLVFCVCQNVPLFEVAVLFCCILSAILVYIPLLLVLTLDKTSRSLSRPAYRQL